MNVRSRPWRQRVLSLVLLSSLCVLGVDSHAQARFAAEGRVIAVDETRGTVTLDHGPIGDVMAATRTEFPADRVELLRMVRVGDVVQFSLVVSQESHGVLSIAELEPGPTADAGLPRGRVGLADVPLWSLLLLWTVLLAVVWLEGYRARRALRDTRKDLVETANAQQDVRQRLRAVANALEEIAWTVRDGYLRELRRQTEAVHAALASSEPGQLCTVRQGNTGPAGTEATPDAARRPSASPFLAVVRGGADEAVRTLQEHFADHGQIPVVWDRRIGDRRTHRQRVELERRSGERRRRPPPMSWDTLNFVLVPQGGERAP